MTSEECRSYLETLPNGKLKITPKDVERIIDGWIRYRKCIEEAIVSIVKTNDAMFVEQNGAHHSKSVISPTAGSFVSDDNSTKYLHVGPSVTQRSHNSLRALIMSFVLRWFSS